MSHVFLNDLLPIFFILSLGYISGKKLIFTADNAQTFNKLVLDYALPIALFTSIVKADRSMLFADMTVTIASIILLFACYLLSFISCLKLFKRNKSEAAVGALIAGSPTVGVLGYAVLAPIYGTGTTTGIIVAIVAIAQHILVIPFGLYLLHPADEHGNKKHSNPLIAALKEPVVFIPMIAIILVLTDIKFPSALDPSLNLIGQTKSGIAVFAAGITLSIHKLELSAEIAYNTILKLILMPAIALAIGLAFNLRGDILQMLVLISALPPSFSGVIIGSRYQIYVRTGTSSLATSMLLFMIAAPVWIMITRYITTSA